MPTIRASQKNSDSAYQEFWNKLPQDKRNGAMVWFMKAIRQPGVRDRILANPDVTCSVVADALNIEESLALFLGKKAVSFFAEDDNGRANPNGATSS